jgi:hypothetical protein
MDVLFELFPVLQTYAIYAATGLGGFMVLSTAFIVFAKVVVKLTFWTNVDDDMLIVAKNRYKKLTEGPLAPLIKLIDRFSVLKDTV